MSWTTLQLLGTILLGLVFGSSALAKVLSFNQFVVYLSTSFRTVATGIAAALIGVEVILSLALFSTLVFDSPSPEVVPIALALFMVVTTAYVSYRLVITDETRCGCWGIHQQPLGEREGVIASSLRPAWYGFRNGLLLLIACLLLDIGKQGHITMGVLEVIGVLAVCPLIILIGLVASILYGRMLINREEHPKKRMLAPYLAPLVALTWYQDGIDDRN
jgi:hypothetical protein